jgi:hypothetical protein
VRTNINSMSMVSKLLLLSACLSITCNYTASAVSECHLTVNDHESLRGPSRTRVWHTPESSRLRGLLLEDVVTPAPTDPSDRNEDALGASRLPIDDTAHCLNASP